MKKSAANSTESDALISLPFWLPNSGLEYSLASISSSPAFSGLREDAPVSIAMPANCLHTPASPYRKAA